MVYARTMTTLTMDLARGAFRLWCTVLDERRSRTRNIADADTDTYVYVQHVLYIIHRCTAPAARTGVHVYYYIIKSKEHIGARVKARTVRKNLRRSCNREMTEKILSTLYSRRADIKLCFTLALTRMPEAAAYGFAAYPRSASSFDELQSAPPPPTTTRAANSNDNIRRGEEAERELSANEASAARSSLSLSYSLFDISRGACHSKQSRKSNRRYNAHTHIHTHIIITTFSRYINFAKTQRLYTNVQSVYTRNNTRVHTCTPIHYAYLRPCSSSSRVMERIKAPYTRREREREEHKHIYTRSSSSRRASAQQQQQQRTQRQFILVRASSRSTHANKRSIRRKNTYEFHKSHHLVTQQFVAMLIISERRNHTEFVNRRLCVTTRRFNSMCSRRTIVNTSTLKKHDLFVISNATQREAAVMVHTDGSSSSNNNNTAQSSSGSSSNDGGEDYPTGARGPATSQSFRLLKTFKSLNFGRERLIGHLRIFFKVLKTLPRAETFHRKALPRRKISTKRRYISSGNSSSNASAQAQIYARALRRDAEEKSERACMRCTRLFSVDVPLCIRKTEKLLFNCVSFITSERASTSSEKEEKERKTLSCCIHDDDDEMETPRYKHRGDNCDAFAAIRRNCRKHLYTATTAAAAASSAARNRTPAARCRRCDSSISYRRDNYR
ncbi:unnamed protein product [Trichogramma brassicae]|uniref:Uncharacterized protein n=1 Tax=Trichogramma brassicae TaxID=86971 RepID=A0A6H5J493_9HYME|nr:unnamed protein product [Trichogramma brassicae]